jgi:hypothetical protein
MTTLAPCGGLGPAVEGSLVRLEEPRIAPSRKSVQQGAEHPVGSPNDRRAGFRQQKRLARIEQGISQVLTVGIRDLLRVLTQPPVAGRKRVESTVDRTRWADGWGNTAEGAHQGYIGTARLGFSSSWI